MIYIPVKTVQDARAFASGRITTADAIPYSPANPFLFGFFFEKVSFLRLRRPEHMNTVYQETVTPESRTPRTGENSLVYAMYVNAGYVYRLAERWRANVHWRIVEPCL